MFEAFSSGYYLGRLYVEPTGGERAAINSRHHEQVNEQLYAGEDDAIVRTDLPLVMKLGAAHLAVDGEAAVPERTLAVPEAVLESVDVDNPPSLEEVLLAKRDHAARLVDMGAV